MDLCVLKHTEHTSPEFAQNLELLIYVLVCAIATGFWKVNQGEGIRLNM
jgi:hypothetical protein